MALHASLTHSTPLALLLLLACCTAPTAVATVPCASFTTCADCACARSGYDVSMSCWSGCGWVPETGTCYSLSSLPTSPNVTNLFKYPSHSGTEQDRAYQLSNGDLMCPLPAGQGTVITLAVLAGATLLGYLYSLAYYLAPRCYYTGSLAGVSSSLRQAVPASEAVVWQGETKPMHDSDGLLIVLTVMHTFFFAAPVLFWLYVGLPSALQGNQWAFSFYFPLGMLAGVGLMLELTLAAVLGWPQGHTARAFALTRSSFVTVAAVASRRGQVAKVKHQGVVRLQQVACVTLAKGVVSFKVAAKCQHVYGVVFPLTDGSTRVSLRGLGQEQAEEVFKML